MENVCKIVIKIKLCLYKNPNGGSYLCVSWTARQGLLCLVFEGNLNIYQ